MPKVTKKSIRELLGPMSRQLLRTGVRQVIYRAGLRIVCEPLYNAPGSLVSWSPHFAAYDQQTGMNVHGGTLSVIVDQLHRRWNA